METDDGIPVPPTPTGEPATWAACPVCDRHVLLNPGDGTLMAHAARCPGSSRPPGTDDPPMRPVLGPV